MRRSRSSSPSRQSTRGARRARAKAAPSRPPTSAFAPRPRTSGKAPAPSSRNAYRNSMEADMTDHIFSGLKVVDLASFIAGPSAAVILSDFGADVIKVEPPAGDLWRRANNMPPQPVSKEAYPWHLTNRNKRGVVLDLKSPAARPVLEPLVPWAHLPILHTPPPPPPPPDPPHPHLA